MCCLLIWTPLPPHTHTHTLTRPLQEITAVETAKVLKSQPALNKVVKSIGFKHLTFGGAPFRVESECKEGCGASP